MLHTCSQRFAAVPTTGLKKAAIFSAPVLYHFAVCDIVCIRYVESLCNQLWLIKKTAVLFGNTLDLKKTKKLINWNTAVLKTRVLKVQS